jgi:heptosyltransferase II
MKKISKISKISKVLIINPFGIGDVLFSTPLVKSIKKKYPQASIAYVCNKRAYGVLVANPMISKLHIFEKDAYRKMWEESKMKALKALYSFLKELKKERYDVVFDASLGYMASLLMAVFARIPVRIGFNYRDRGGFLTHKLDIKGFNDKHAIEYYLGLGELIGLDTSDKEMELFVSAEDRQWAGKFLMDNGISPEMRISGVIPGCGASWGKDANYRRWSPWKFAETADHLADTCAFKTLIFGEASELGLCASVAGQMKSKSVQVCGKTTLGQLSALLDRCEIILTNDGGPLHMSVALKKKIVAIFGPVDENIYGPYPPSDKHIAITSSEKCRPCYRGFKYSKCEAFECLKNIKPEKVKSAAHALLGSEGYVR